MWKPFLGLRKCAASYFRNSRACWASVTAPPSAMEYTMKSAAINADWIDDSSLSTMVHGKAGTKSGFERVPLNWSYFYFNFLKEPILPEIIHWPVCFVWPHHLRHPLPPHLLSRYPGNSWRGAPKLPLPYMYQYSWRTLGGLLSPRAFPPPANRSQYPTFFHSKARKSTIWLTGLLILESPWQLTKTVLQK